MSATVLPFPDPLPAHVGQIIDHGIAYVLLAEADFWVAEAVMEGR